MLLREYKLMAPEGANEGAPPEAPAQGQPNSAGGNAAAGGQSGSEGDGGSAGSPSPAAAEGTQTPPAPPTPQTWQERRLGEVSAAKRQVETQRDRLAYENQMLKAQLDELTARGRRAPAQAPAAGAPPAPPQAAPPQPQPHIPTQADFEAAVEAESARKAAVIARANEFAQKCNSTVAEGRKAFEDFDQALGKFAPLGGLDPELVDLAIDTGAGHQIIHHLSGNLDEYERIRTLPPVKRAIELDRLGQRIAAGAAPEISRAPRPPVPVGAGRGSGGSKDPSKMTMAEYHEWRNKSKEKRAS